MLGTQYFLKEKKKKKACVVGLVQIKTFQDPLRLKPASIFNYYACLNKGF